MKLRSALNNGFLFLGIGSIFIGLLRIPSDFNYYEALPLFVFFVFFRIKMWLDDAVYFQTTERKNMFFDIGVIMAIVAWCLWAAAGYTIAIPEVSYTILALSLVFLSGWIIVDAIHGRSFGKDRKYFLILNFVYAAALWMMGTDSVDMPFPKAYLAWVLVVGTAIDFLFHGSMKHFEEEIEQRKP